MIYRQLGDTGITVSEIGMGCGGLGGGRKQGLEGSLNYAFDQGVTLYDTADMYAEGRSEETLGKVFAGRRQKVVFATKFATVIGPDGKAFKDVSTAHMREALEVSLRRLRTDYVDVYQLHNPPMRFLEDGELIGALDALVDSGKIRCYGLSIDNGADALRFLDTTRGRSIEMFLNLFGQAAREPFLAEASRRRAGVIVKVPLAGGALSGRFTSDSPPPSDSRRRRWGEEDFRRRLELAEMVRPILEQPGRTLGQGALAWLLTLEGVTSVIPGISSLDKVTENVGAAGMRLTPAEMRALDEVGGGAVRKLQLPW